MNINPMSKEKELSHALRDSKPKGMLFSICINSSSLSFSDIAEFVQ